MGVVPVLLELGNTYNRKYGEAPGVGKLTPGTFYKMRFYTAQIADKKNFLPQAHRTFTTVLYSTLP